MSILSIDIGKNTGWCYEDQAGQETGTIDVDYKDLMGFYWAVYDKVSVWHPQVILVPKPVRFYNTQARHWELIGLIKLIAQKAVAEVELVIDSSCKKVVLGTGRADKEEIMKHFGEENEHIADAKLFIEYYKKTHE